MVINNTIVNISINMAVVNVTTNINHQSTNNKS